MNEKFENSETKKKVQAHRKIKNHNQNMIKNV